MIYSVQFLKYAVVSTQPVLKGGAHMSYKIGQKVCLWQVMLGANFWPLDNQRKIQILKEVIVTITETKTGVRGEWSDKSVSSQSLRGIGDDGKTYEKHWDSWPESQTHDFADQWSMRDEDAGDGRKFWIPMEAVRVYNDVTRENRRIAQNKLALVSMDDTAIKPKGDIAYCETHDRYEHEGVQCFYCRFPEVARHIV